MKFNFWSFNQCEHCKYKSENLRLEIYVSLSTLHQKCCECCVPKYLFDRCWHQGYAAQIFRTRWKRLPERLQVSLVQIAISIHQVTGEVLSQWFAFMLLKEKKKLFSKFQLNIWLRPAFPWIYSEFMLGSTAQSGARKRQGTGTAARTWTLWVREKLACFFLLNFTSPSLCWPCHSLEGTALM